MEEIKYRREDEMKDSGIEWLGKIPKEWEVKKLKYLVNHLNGYAFKSDNFIDQGVPVIRIGDISDNINFDETKKVEKHDIYKPYIIKKGDILVALTGATIGKSTYFNYDNIAYLNQRVGIFRSYKFNQKLIYYWIKTNMITEYIRLICSGSAQDNISNSDIAKFSITLPDTIMQQKIANFLDIKTSQFDSIISKKEKLIEKLEEAKKSLISEVVTGKVKIVDGEIVERKADEMKDSGVEWLGKIPKDWEVKRLKYLAECYPSNVDKKSRPGEKEVKLCNYTDVYYNDFIIDELDFMKATASDSQIIKYSLNKGDIVLTKDSESPDDIGVASYVDECIDNLVCGYHLTIVKMHKKYYSLYFYYLLQTAGVKNYFGTVANGITRFGIGVSGFKDLIVCIPSNKEQREISKYLRQQIEKNTTIINKTKTQIQKLKEAKQSLISEAVTGKIDLRDWEIREVDES